VKTCTSIWFEIVSGLLYVFLAVLLFGAWYKPDLAPNLAGGIFWINVSSAFLLGFFFFLLNRATLKLLYLEVGYWLISLIASGLGFILSFSVDTELMKIAALASGTAGLIIFGTATAYKYFKCYN
jgi:hypothetical protein